MCVLLPFGSIRILHLRSRARAPSIYTSMDGEDMKKNMSPVGVLIRTALSLQTDQVVEANDLRELARRLCPADAHCLDGMGNDELMEMHGEISLIVRVHMATPVIAIETLTAQVLVMAMDDGTVWAYWFGSADEEWEKQYLMRLATVSVRRNQWTRLSRVPSQHRIVSVAVRGTTGFLAVTADGVLWYLSDKQSVEPNGILGIGDSSTSNWRWTRDSSTPFPGTVGNPSRETVVVAPTESDSTP